MKKKLLICGASGFIGRNIAEAFAANSDFEVYGTYLKAAWAKDRKIKMIKADLTDKDDVNAVIKGIDIVIQAAATTSGAKDTVTKPYYHVTDNAVMNSLIFRAACEHKVSRVIFFSCSIVYQSSDSPVKEADFDASKEMYPSYFGAGWTKVYIEKMCEFYSRLRPTAYTVIRHSNIYGPYDKFDLQRSHVFGATVAKVMNAKEGGTIIVWGDGKEERDLLYVSDLVKFVETALYKQKSDFEIYNVGRGASISVDDLVRKIIAHSGRKLKIEYDRSKPSIKTKVCLDIGKAKGILGWVPAVSLDEGIKKTLEWYKANMPGGEQDI